MGKLQRFSVCLDEDLLEKFDSLRERKKSPTRSEAIRDLIRGALVENRWGADCEYAFGALSLVYDHHKHDLARRLMRLQHEDHDLIICSQHVHLDHENCLETLVLKGRPERVRALADNLIGCRGVKHGVFNPMPAGGDLA